MFTIQASNVRRFGDLHHRSISIKFLFLPIENPSSEFSESNLCALDRVRMIELCHR